MNNSSQDREQSGGGLLRAGKHEPPVGDAHAVLAEIAYGHLRVPYFIRCALPHKHQYLFAESIKYFSELTDPRVERNREHLLEEILLIAIAAVLSGAESWNDIADYGKDNRDRRRTRRSAPALSPMTMKAWSGFGPIPCQMGTSNAYTTVVLIVTALEFALQ